MNISAFRKVKQIAIRRLNAFAEWEDKDLLAAEEPLEIRIEGQSVAVVMRTPGEDCELAVGFLVTEGVVRNTKEVIDISCQPHCLSAARNGNSPPKSLETTLARKRGLEDKTKTNHFAGNVVDVHLRNPNSVDVKKLTRHVFTSSSCGICSKASITAVQQQFPPIDDSCEVDPRVLSGLPRALTSAQETFKQTGGLHACALFDLTGELRVLREDVGRHNALDKVVGWALLEGRLPLREHIILLSGRTSFEMMQKALSAGIPIVAAVSAPSTLAVEFAQDSGQTLIGFLREERMNIYAGAGRVRKFALTGGKSAQL